MIHLGVDFGTANTRVSLHERNVPKPLNIGRGGYFEYMMPSTCWVDPDGNIVVGEQTLARPGRLKFIKRFWQRRADDVLSNPWPNGQRMIAGRVFTCEQMVEAVIGEALSRAMSQLSKRQRDEGFTANVVCPVDFGPEQRFKLVQILSSRGARGVTLGNVIDEPLAAAVLYGRLEEHPPVKRDILVFDAGAGTVDVAIVRYEERDGQRRMTVLAESGRCRAGADLDDAMEGIVGRELMKMTGTSNIGEIYAAYAQDPEAGRVAFESECEAMKQQLARSNFARLVPKRNFLGVSSVELQVSSEELMRAARVPLFEMRDAVRCAQKMAETIVEDFRHIELVILVGGTSRLPFVRDAVTAACPGAAVVRNDYLDEMLATVRGAGFHKDYTDLVILRPPYTTELRITLKGGSTQTLTVGRAFEEFPRFQFFSTAVPVIKKRESFSRPITSVEVVFISPAGKYLKVTEEELPPDTFASCGWLEARLDIHARLCLSTDRKSKWVQAPYFTQVGLAAARPFRMKELNAPDVYPDDN